MVDEDGKWELTGLRVDDLERMSHPKKVVPRGPIKAASHHGMVEKPKGFQPGLHGASVT